MLLSELARDYRRHGSSLRNPALWAIATYHFGVWSKGLRVPALRWFTSKVYGGLSFGVELSSGITLHRETAIGRDFHLVHSGNIKIHPRARIGDRVGVLHNVTIGEGVDREGVPVIGDDVFIGTGARVLGPVVIGNGARIAANSLVLSDVPAGATAVGVPARILRYTGRQRAETSSASE
jgi:serine O-acetyltransferase